jgi:AraC family transcriptional regulator
MQQLLIKNMVCARCIKSVREIFFRHAAEVQAVHLGVVELKESLQQDQKEYISRELLHEGFELLDNQKTKLVQQMKQLIIELVHYSDMSEFREKLSAYLSGKMHKNYHYLSGLFSAVEGLTIEQYFILQKIEKIKEWLFYDELSLGEIAFRMGYSSVAHLSSQFKKVTGQTPSRFKQERHRHRKHIDSIR